MLRCTVSMLFHAPLHSINAEGCTMEMKASVAWLIKPIFGILGPA